MSRTLGQHIASRLVEIGVTHVFGVPGDFNLVLLDQLIKEERLTWVGCCNELNAGYAADGYARARGVGCCVATFTVGGLSLINAVAGSYSESLPVIVITGGPNSNDFGTSHVLHHTIGLQDWGQEERCFKEVTCHQVQIKSLDDAHEVVDHAIASALIYRKPVYINISCNIAGLPHPVFDGVPVPFCIYEKRSNPKSLEVAVGMAADFLNKATKPVIIAGVKVRKACEAALLQVADAAGYPVGVMPNAKSFFPEDHPNFVGTYWGQVSTPYAAEIIESADAYLIVGAVFNDYTTTGWTLLLKEDKMVKVDANSVTIEGRKAFHCIVTSEFLLALSAKIKRNTKAMDNFKRMYMPLAQLPTSSENSALTNNVLYKHIGETLTGDTAILAETGDSWFNCQKLKLPNGCRYEFQCQYGSIDKAPFLCCVSALALFAFRGAGVLHAQNTNNNKLTLPVQ